MYFYERDKISKPKMSIMTNLHFYCFDSVATISFEEAVFPLALKRGQSVDVFIHEPYKLSSHDELLLEITITKDQSFTKHFRLTQSIPKGYLKQIANEANDE
ncbi:hypothetical protein ASG99_21185 [Bacillus sp. Soil768D1]|nr:hypothetical protein ASG99_21185 [Bacillus sp. Soil768D1]